jgi:hypothetical protein
MKTALARVYPDQPLTSFDARGRHVAFGRALWEQLYNQLEGGAENIPPLRICEHPDLARKVPGLLAFGHAVATVCHRRASGDPSLEPALARLGALLNAAVCAVDRIWDAEQESLESLVTLVTEDWIHVALDASISTRQWDERRLSLRLGSAPALACFACRALDAYIDGVRELVAVRGTSRHLRPLVEAAQGLLRAHRTAAKMRIGTTPPDVRVAETLRAVGLGPFELMARTSLLASSTISDSTAADLWNVVTAFGEAFWRLDDLCDAFEDLEALAWSSLWLDVAGSGVDLLDESGRPRTAALLAALRKTRMADAVAIGVLDALANGNRDESLEMLAWAWSWVTD